MTKDKTKNIYHEKLLAGIDIGSTTTKLVVVDFNTRDILYSDYRRHHADQVQSVFCALEQINKQFPDNLLQVGMTGSGAKTIAEQLGLPFIQEVAANAEALQSQYKDIGTAIELGGQDAKMIFFRKEKGTNTLNVADMRMNGSCAGGTGAFIYEIASVLKVPVEEFNALAEKGTCVYDISGRCGVYAKTDIQPLLNQGIAKEDLALSAFHAIAKQTIGGLAQGLEIKPPVAFEGGPLTFHKTLVKVFAERLQLEEKDILLPPHGELMVAYGAAISMRNIEKRKKDCRAAELLQVLEARRAAMKPGETQKGKPLFQSEEQRQDFQRRHKKQKRSWKSRENQKDVYAYLGIDSGSTTTKFVLINQEEEILESFYAPNEGVPLDVAKRALIAMRERYREKGCRLHILAAGTTGYGEQLFAKAFQVEYHTVETVAHARAAEKYVKDASFILDIGGQDMKAIWLEKGIITNILVNEACSSGCGSFLENFASSLHIPVEKIAEAAFSSKCPAVLGSRCTVFMNSSIITEQRNGRHAEDIMAGLCRSIIENVFTKVVRLSNVDSLGDKIVVQGGTFENDAVLRAMEEYIGKEVTRAPYPGLMGAIGVALIAREQHQREPDKHTFIDLNDLDGFSYRQEANIPCPFCSNHCKRTILQFSNGQSWITNNRCEKGEIVGNPKEEKVKEQLRLKKEKARQIPNLFKVREEMLFQEYEYPRLLPERDTVIGIPRILSYWETAPFWSTFWRSLGFSVKFSDFSTRKIYESGLPAVTSDTVCFPAKLVHGHIRNLVKKGVNRIFMPVITTVPSENMEETSQSMCAVVKGYPLVIQNSDNPARQWDVSYDAPVFHWYTEEDKKKQLIRYMKETFEIPGKLTVKAIKAGNQAQELFQRELKKKGKEVLEQTEKENKFAVVLASRPYQNDSLVNHELPEMFAGFGIPVLTVDSLPESSRIDLSKSRLDIVNNYHARMLSSAIIAAESKSLEYVQLVSFGCGHDAYLSDEIIRIMKDVSDKAPLILKVDESDIQGPLRIRVRSFLETIERKRKQGIVPVCQKLKAPYPVKYTKEDRQKRVVLVPNTSHAFCRVMSAAFCTQGIRAVPLDVGREEAIRLGKKYVHNDICFPAQVVIGEALAALESGKYNPENTAIGMAKYIGDCRLTHYGALLRKALDDAGFSQVPILTNDDKDSHGLHPGFRLNLISSIRIAFAMPMIDALEELLRKIRPYELEKGETDRAFEKAMDALVEGLEQAGVKGAKEGFERGIRYMMEVPYDDSHRKPQVLIVGEYLLNFHPGANHEIERYLEQNGFEIIEARMTDVIRKTYFYQDKQIQEYHVKRGAYKTAWFYTADHIFNLAHETADRIARKHPLYQPPCRLQDLVKDSDGIIHHTFDAGEGVLIPGEILHHAKEGCRTFVILQPFGCLPNHIVGRGVAKKLKEEYPDAQILPLDYDPDVSFANIENRLQMLVMNMRRAEDRKESRQKQLEAVPVLS